MYLNGFSVRVVGGNENGSGYVAMQHGQTYSLVMRNDNLDPCDAYVEVDGKHIGTWRINSQSNIQIERPTHDQGRLTFYKTGTVEAQQAQLPEYSSDLGLVKVTFTPGKYPVATWRLGEVKDVHPLSHENPFYESKGYIAAAAVPSYSAGGTGLSGHSNQMFTTVESLNYDYSRQTVIHLRLVCEDSGPRPLTSFSTPVPPAVR